MRGQTSAGLPYALGAYLIWGVLPIYLRLVHHVPPFEFVGWRVVFTLPFCLALIAFRRQAGAVKTALTQPRTLMTLTASALLIGANWLIYIWAIQRGHVLASSLGYYINPLANVLAGTLFLGERLSRRQWLAVALAAIGVTILAFGALDMLGISLSLAATFCGYGLVRKLAPVEAIPGLTVETLLLLVPGLLLIASFAASPTGSAMSGDLVTDLLIAASGIVTGLPLVLFATAARRMDYSSLGFVQFLSPTLVFLEGLLLFHEPLRPVQLASFGFIWLAIGLFVIDLFARRRLSA
jgi:chloramphenicol-sensitive protein RarD